MRDAKKNIFWFIIDSVRPYKSGLDDRDRLDVMDEFAKESIEFTNCFTSAPSSLLAAGSLFTGLPAAFVSRHFNDWKFIDPGISTIKTLVDEHGYQSIPLIDGRNAREKYQELLPPFPSKFLPRNYHLSDYVWTNKQVTHIFNNILQKHTKEPFVFVFWYDCRRDPKTSDYVEDAINLIKESGYYDESIIVMNSDHGYPDPSTSLDERFFKNLGHDMILTDDNIRTPLFIKYPGSPTDIKIENVVGHVDILPTIFDIVDIPLSKPYDDMELRGRSLLNIINNNEMSDRVVRSDTRLRMDNNRITSYRSSKYKYIKFYDDNEVVLYDLNKDPMETSDISKCDDPKIRNILSDFDKLDAYYDKKLMENQVVTLKNNFSKVVHKLSGVSDKRNNVIIISPAPEEFINILADLLRQNFDIENITLINVGSFFVGASNVDRVIKSEKIDNNVLNSIEEKSFDLLIYLTHNTKRVYLKSELVEYIGKIKSRKKLLMNYNFEIFDYFSFRSFFSYIKLFFQFERKWYFYKQEPRYFVTDIWFYMKYSIKYYFKKRRQPADGDIMTAREILAYRNHHLSAVNHGVEEMNDKQLDYETQRIKDWGKE